MMNGTSAVAELACEQPEQRPRRPPIAWRTVISTADTDQLRQHRERPLRDLEQDARTTVLLRMNNLATPVDQRGLLSELFLRNIRCQSACGMASPRGLSRKSYICRKKTVLELAAYHGRAVFNRGAGILRLAVQPRRCPLHLDPAERRRATGVEGRGACGLHASRASDAGGG